ncbi:acyl-CoA dehydrogenase family protein [Pseudonocardia sp. C8]|uniref:acyl-CoA dehydrogenase family protein n=1 Tax=Pseudonocardia sp. C8 TaxID=2762759 RepID=UPI0016431BE5|nr:acyl-CoA dehydrogenase family protein [Pseudonocardia sp. C8]MBC3192971.1 acyl-CoA dehydrogenase family protein [Pseudonocardia sp. C8]
MDRTERTTFDRAVQGILADVWGGPGSAATGCLDPLWAAAVDAGWLDLAGSGALGALVRAARGMGRVACPLPLADSYVAVELLGEQHPALGARIRDAVVRPLVVSGPDVLRTLDAVPTATHVVELPPTGPARVVPIESYRVRPGVPVPALAEAQVGEPELEAEVSDAQRRHAFAVLRLALAARAIAAAERSLELATEHAMVRHQFGRPIGSFGAVQQRIADSHIDARAAGLLIEEAIRLSPSGHGAGSGDAGVDASERWLLAVALAVEHARTAASHVQFGAQHTLGAIGFFDEHEAPWLFRRVHTDIARLLDLPAESVADRLLGADRSLPPVDLDAGAAEFRHQLRTFLSESGLRRHAPQPFIDDPDTVRTLADANLFGLAWPPEHGGRGLRGAEQAVLMEEVGYGRVAASAALNAVMFLGDAIIRFGSAAQRDTFLPLIRQGRLRFCLGYSEPETGSDLGGLVTRAVRDGDGWVVNGQKTWTTRAHESDWIWLAVRTDPDRSKRHAGISVFLVPLSTPGITVKQHRSQAGEVSCSVFLDEVRVADDARIGDVSAGWSVITTALAGERVAMGAVTGSLHALLDELLTLLRREPELAGPPGSVKRAHVTTLATRLQAARLLVRDAVEAITAGTGSRIEAPMAGVMGGELAEQFGRTVPELLGPQALLEDAPGNGTFGHNLLLSVKYVVGGGTNDVLRGLIARGLGLPR